MKKLGIVLFALLSCTQTSPTPTPISGIIDCGTNEIKSAGIDLISSVQKALASNDWAYELDALVTKHGTSLIACVVDSVVHRSQTDYAHAPGDTLSKTKADRGQSWLQSKNIIIKGQ